MVDFDIESRMLFRKALLITITVTLVQGAGFILLLNVLPGGLGGFGAGGIGVSITELLMGPDTLLALLALGLGWVNGAIASNVWGGLSRWLYLVVVLQAFLITYVAVFVATDIADLKLNDTSMRCTIGCVLTAIAGWFKLKWEMAE